LRIYDSLGYFDEMFKDSKPEAWALSGFMGKYILELGTSHF